MKKFVALIMALIMSFSIALIPASAVEIDTAATQETVDEAFAAIEKAVYLIQDTIEQIHNIVGQIMTAIGQDCAMCGQAHVIAEEGVNDDLVVEMEKVEMLAA